MLPMIDNAHAAGQTGSLQTNDTYKPLKTLKDVIAN